MFTTVCMLYILSTITCMITIAMVIKLNVNEGQKYMLAFMIMAGIQNVGYLFELIAKTADAAFVAIKMQYLGSTFIMFFLCEYVIYFFKEKRFQKLFRVLGVLNILIMVSVWITDLIPVFYTKMEFVSRGVHPHFILTHGFMFYVFFIVSELIPLVCIVFTIIHSSIVRNTGVCNVRNLGYLIAIVVPLAAFLTNLLGNEREFDYTPFFITMVLSVLVLVCWRYSDRDISQLTAETLMDGMEDIVVAVDEFDHVIAFNRLARSTFGNMMGKPFTDFFPGVVLKKKGGNSIDFNLNGKSYEGHIKAIRDSREKIAGYLVIFFDVTKIHNHMLELRTLKEKAEAANRTKNAFLASMSHEIRTPMNSIMGMTKLMERENLTDVQREYLENIEYSGKALISIFNDILDISKLESGELDFEEKEYELYSIMNDLGMSFLNAVAGRPIEILFDIDPNVPDKLYGDEKRVRQVISNLVISALRYTEKGYIKVRMCAEQVAYRKTRIHISVIDSGFGLTDKELKNLLNAFEDVELEDTLMTEGTAIALSLCKSFVEQMNGSISVDSKIGEGTQFDVTIEQGIMSDVRDKKDLFPEWKQHHFSIITDNKLMKQQFSETIDKMGYQYIDYHEAQGNHTRIEHLYFDMQQYELYKKDSSAFVEADSKYLLVDPIHVTIQDTEFTTINKPFYTFSFYKLYQNKKKAVQDGSKPAKNAVTWIAPDANVLLVDDNKVNIKVAVRLLKPTKMKIDVALDGKQCLEMMDEKEYDLILMDHMMPVMDGIEATERLRASDSVYKQRIPIIALTANAVVGAKERFFEAGMNDFVAKPIDLKLLLKAIERNLPNSLIVPVEEGNNTTE